MLEVRMPDIRVVGVTKNFRDVTAVDNVSLEIKSGEYATLLGPSGCGKTSLLRMIAGLVNPTSGKIFIGGKDATGLPAEERNIGFVFQNYALFPHLTVWGNVSYGPVVRGQSWDKVREITQKMLELVNLAKRADAYPHELSGGMQQRVVLARALASGSDIILLDEPLSALDAKLGTTLRYELRKMVKKFGLTAVHVTHNQEEAMAISDKIIVMKAGRVMQVGSPREIYEKPDSPFVANFIGACNFLSCRVTGKYTAEWGGVALKVNKKLQGEKVLLAVRPEKISIMPGKKRGMISGRVEFVDFLGDKFGYVLRVNENTRISVTRKTGVDLKVGDSASVCMTKWDFVVLPNPDNLADELNLG